MKPISNADIEAALVEPRKPQWDIGSRVPSAVAVPLVERRAGVELWLIRRPDGMRHHAGEFAFPGGKADPHDRTLLDTALRETEEELGVPRTTMRLLGKLMPMPVATSRFAIHPFAIGIDPSAQPTPALDEVAELIRVPIAAFFEGHVGYAVVDVGAYISPIFTFAAGRMYGASAHILQELLETCAQIAGTRLPTPERVEQVPWLRAPGRDGDGGA
jgi:8-oxo-dGTP pyrophosphatase MutT (NUDIX family)